MSFAATIAAPADAPDPPQDQVRSGAPQRTRSRALLALVRKLFDYGKGVILALEQRPPFTQAHAGDIARRFGTPDIKLIGARVLRGLRLALALRDRLTRDAASLDRPPVWREPAIRPARPPRAAGTAPPPARPRVRRDPIEAAAAAEAAEDAALRAGVPTDEEIARRVLRRPIGAVLADLCLDLGITPEHPLWHELRAAVISNGATFVRVTMRASWRLLRGPAEFARALKAQQQARAAAGMPADGAPAAGAVVQPAGVAHVAAAATGPP